MSLTLRLANRLILCDTRHYIDPEDRTRVVIPGRGDKIEAWIINAEAEPDFFCLKFPGTGGRAERAGPHPCEVLTGNFEVWAINPPGYGTSSGRACVRKMIETCESAWAAIEKRAAGRPVIVTGNSLGGMYALFVAARFPVSGVLLRNPAPVHQLIRGKYSWWNAGLASRLVGSHVPQAMDAVVNARNCSAHALFVISERDRMVPRKYQNMIIDQYGGPSSQFLIRGADHHHPVPQEILQSYQASLAEWGQSLALASSR
jgi:pimeloyl-ACP methyl ester carboxylesterase